MKIMILQKTAKKNLIFQNTLTLKIILKNFFYEIKLAINGTLFSEISKNHHVCVKDFLTASL